MEGSKLRALSQPLCIKSHSAVCEMNIQAETLFHIKCQIGRIQNGGWLGVIASMTFERVLGKNCWTKEANFGRGTPGIKPRSCTKGGMSSTEN